VLPEDYVNISTIESNSVQGSLFAAYVNTLFPQHHIPLAVPEDWPGMQFFM